MVDNRMPINRIKYWLDIPSRRFFEYTSGVNRKAKIKKGIKQRKKIHQ